MSAGGRGTRPAARRDDVEQAATIAASRSRSSTLDGRCSVTYVVAAAARGRGGAARRERARARRFAHAACRSSRCRPGGCAAGRSPSRRRFSSRVAGSVSSSRSASASVTSAVDLLGHARGRSERRPASTWATGMPSFDAPPGRGHRRVDVAHHDHPVGPRTACEHRLEARHDPAVCAAWLPEPTSRLTSGARNAELVEEDLGHRLRRSAGRCGRAAARSGRARGQRAASPAPPS